MADYELTDQEVEVINYLRGFDEDANEVANGMRLTIECRGGGFCVDTRHGFEGPTLIGEGPDFDFAWMDRCDARLRYGLADELDPAVETIHPEKIHLRPRLMLVRGGKDGEL